MRKCWLLIVVGSVILSVAVWQWEWIYGQIPEPLDLPDCPAPIEYPITSQCRHEDGYILPFSTDGNEMLPFVYYFTLGFIFPTTMIFIGLMGLLGRGPMIKQPKNSTE